MDRLMTDAEIVKAWDDISKVLNKDQNEFKHNILSHIGNRWSLFVMYALGNV